MLRKLLPACTFQSFIKIPVRYKDQNKFPCHLNSQSEELPRPKQINKESTVPITRIQPDDDFPSNLRHWELVLQPKELAGKQSKQY